MLADFFDAYDFLTKTSAAARELREEAKRLDQKAECMYQKAKAVCMERSSPDGDRFNHRPGMSIEELRRAIFEASARYNSMIRELQSRPPI